MSDDNGLVWEVPPGNAKYSSGWSVILSQLRTRPGEWALVYTQRDDENTHTARGRRGQIQKAALQEGLPIQVTSRIVDDRVKVYARAVES